MSTPPFKLPQDITEPGFYWAYVPRDWDEDAMVFTIIEVDDGAGFHWVGSEVHHVLRELHASTLLFGPIEPPDIPG